MKRTYTMRFAHLKNPSGLRVDSTIKQGDAIGVMGSSGASTAAHLHLDVVEGIVTKNWRLSDYESGVKTATPKQLARCLNKRLFGVYPVVTTAYDDRDYYVGFGKLHSAFDLVPEDRHETQGHYLIRWPLLEHGVVTFAGYDNGYGNSVLISYEA